jgi:hypothetical protein
LDELLNAGKKTHTIPPPKEYKRRAYCKFHISYSHVTNDECISSASAIIQ